MLAGCVTDGHSSFSFLTMLASSPAKDRASPLPTVVAADYGEEDPEEEEDEEEEGTDPLDGWLQAYLYRSPDYQLSLPQRRNRLSEALKTAFELRGTPYRMGGTSEQQGLDCSGLVWVSFASAGIRLPRTSQEQFHATERVDRNALQPGDLVFFKTGRSKKREIDHVGIYVGNGKFLHAPRRGKAVSLASLSEAYWDRRYRGAGRVPGFGAEKEASELLETASLAVATSDSDPPSSRPGANANPEPVGTPVAMQRAASPTKPNHSVTARTVTPSSLRASTTAPSRKGSTVAAAKPIPAVKPEAVPRTGAAVASAGTRKLATTKATNASHAPHAPATASASAKLKLTASSSSDRPSSATATSSKNKPVVSKPSSSPAPSVQKKERERKRIASHP